MISTVAASLSSLFVFIIFIMLVCILRLRNKQDKATFRMRELFINLIIGVFFQGILLFAPNRNVALVFHSLYFITINITCYYLMCFVINFVSYDPKKEITFKVLNCILVVDTLILIANMFTHIMFNCVKVRLEDGFYFVVQKSSLITFHYIISYGVVIYLIYLIVHKLIQISVIYWKKYLILLFFVIAAISTKTLTIFMQFSVDISIVLYSVFTIMVYFAFWESNITLLIEKLLSYIVSNDTDAIVCLDLDENCVYLNDSAKKYFQIKDDNYDNVKKKLDEIISLPNVNHRDEYSALCTMNVNGAARHYEIAFKRLYKDDKVVGSYYRIKDRTIEVEVFNKDRYKASFDKLTGLYNMDYFCDLVEDRLRGDLEKKYYIVGFDIKDFKLINDAFGKDIGDKVLNLIAWKIREKATISCLYCRISADKFCMFIEQSEFQEKNLIQIAEEVSFAEDINYSVTLHIGVYSIENRKLSVSAMIDRAFMAISENKGNYQERIFYYDDKMREDLYWEQKLSGELEFAIADRQLRMFLQPQCDVSGKVVGAEALVRWVHPQEGMIPPIRFIKMFEKNGLISKVDLFIWNVAAKLLRKWKDEGRDYYISINISPADFYFLDIDDELISLVRKYDIDPQKLKLEITETVMMKDIESRLVIIERLRDYGFTVEIDDFGSGYSSLNMLKDMPADVLKLDMRFLYKTKDEAKSRKIIQMIVKLSKVLDMPVICEGVETEEQLEFLKSINCDYFQGYYFSKPVEVAEFEAKM